MKTRYAIGRFSVEFPPGWVEITTDLEAGAPITLAKSDGCGALQFSLAEYSRGRLPDVSMEKLRMLVRDLAMKREFGQGFDQSEYNEGGILLCSESFFVPPDFVRVWYWTDGKNIALLTYVCADSSGREELVDCEEMARSLRHQQSASTLVPDTK